MFLITPLIIKTAAQHIFTCHQHLQLTGVKLQGSGVFSVLTKLVRSPVLTNLFAIMNLSIRSFSAIFRQSHFVQIIYIIVAIKHRTRYICNENNIIKNLKCFVFRISISRLNHLANKTKKFFNYLNMKLDFQILTLVLYCKRRLMVLRIHSASSTSSRLPLQTT